VKRNVGRTVKWREQQQKYSLLDYETCKKQKFLASRLQRPGITSYLKKLLADGLKTGLLAARAISTVTAGNTGGKRGFNAI